jgi:hypothetical protein
MKIISSLDLSTMLLTTSLGRFLRIGGNNFYYCVYNVKDESQYPQVLHRLPNRVSVFHDSKDIRDIISQFREHTGNQHKTSF